MTQTLLMILVIILAEAIIVLPLVLLLYYRKKRTPADDRLPQKQHAADTPASPQLLIRQYLETEIQRTQSELGQTDTGDEITSLALNRRIELLNCESSLLSLSSSQDFDFWLAVAEQYRADTTTQKAVSEPGQTGNEEDTDTQRESEQYRQLYEQEKTQHEQTLQKLTALESETEQQALDRQVLQSRIDGLMSDYEKLSNQLSAAQDKPDTTDSKPVSLRQLTELTREVSQYKAMVRQADNKLNASRDTITELKSLLESSDTAEANADMSRMMAKLSNENETLKEKLDQVLRPSAHESSDLDLRIRQAKDEELCMYMDLVAQANEKLKQNNTTIEELKKCIAAGAPSDELSQLEDMVNELSRENFILQQQLSDLMGNKQPHTDDEGLPLSNDDLEEEIARYRFMIDQTNQQLVSANETIEDLKTLVADSPDLGEISQLEDMIASLSKDNNSLREQLANEKHKANQLLDSLQHEYESRQSDMQEELNMYVGLVNQANAKLRESQATIAELKDQIRTSQGDNTEQMQTMLDTLTHENMNLVEQLHNANTLLQQTLDKICQLEQEDTKIARELEIIKDEKWFLEEQIKHLLQIQQDESRAYLERIEQLERQLDDNRPAQQAN